MTALVVWYVLICAAAGAIVAPDQVVVAVTGRKITGWVLVTLVLLPILTAAIVAAVKAAGNGRHHMSGPHDDPGTGAVAAGEPAWIVRRDAWCTWTASSSTAAQPASYERT
jgi:hypothetical protein